MPYNPKDYRTNRNAVLVLREKLAAETVTTAEAMAMGAKKSELTRWIKEGKLHGVSFGGKSRYNRNAVKTLILESLK